MNLAGAVFASPATPGPTVPTVPLAVLVRVQDENGCWYRRRITMTVPGALRLQCSPLTIVGMAIACALAGLPERRWVRQRAEIWAP